MTMKTRTDLELIDVLTYEAAMAGAEEDAKRPETPEETAAIDRLQSAAREQIRARRRQAFAKLQEQTPPPRKRVIPEHILAMSRDALVVRLDRVAAQTNVSLQVAYRRLEELGDDELRTMLADFEELLAAREP